MHSLLIGYGLFQLKCDIACYALLHPDVAAYIVVYVDDDLIFNITPEWTVRLKAIFATEFDIKDLGDHVRVFGTFVVRDR